MVWRRSRLHVPKPDVSRALAAVPESRNRVVDVLRAWSISVVVAGHAVMAVVVWRDGSPQLGNTLASYPALQWLTWVLQVLPVFFMVGATANSYSWQSAQTRHEPYATWLWHRVRRLLRPVIPYVAILSGWGFLVGQFGDVRTAAPLLTLTTQLLWFLGAYLWVTAATPWFISLRGRSVLSVSVGLLLLVGAIDFVRLVADGPAALGLINFVAVWMLAGVFGVHLSDDVSRIHAAVLAIAALSIDLLLVTVGPYPVSMVGMPGASLSNMDPPTLVLAVHTVTLFAFALLLRDWLTRVAQRPHVWRATVAVNMLMMTIYLWHLPVLTAITVLEHALGWERPTLWLTDTGAIPRAGFWWWTVPHLLAFGFALLATIRVTWVGEYAKLPWWDAEPKRRGEASTTQAVTGIVLIGLGISVVSATGLVGFPTRIVDYEGVPFNSGFALAMLIAGVLMLRRAAAGSAFEHGKPAGLVV